MITQHCPLVLGSASPRRREILSGLGVPIRVEPASVCEDGEAGESPLEYVERIVALKLAAVVDRTREPYAGALVADTIVVVGDEVLGKPNDARDALRLLGKIAGRTHTVYTRYALSLPPKSGRPVLARTVATRVTLRAASSSELERYAATGEGLDKAGAYAAQGIGAFLIERIEGSYSNVVGLPACEVIRDLLASGLLERFP
ncbi:MAG TPA: Maf family protein [Polyangiaceae bacterium]|jgi:septum formation protein